MKFANTVVVTLMALMNIVECDCWVDFMSENDCKGLVGYHARLGEHEENDKVPKDQQGAASIRYSVLKGSFVCLSGGSSNDCDQGSFPDSGEAAHRGCYNGVLPNGGIIVDHWNCVG